MTRVILVEDPPYLCYRCGHRGDQANPVARLGGTRFGICARCAEAIRRAKE